MGSSRSVSARKKAKAVGNRKKKQDPKDEPAQITQDEESKHASTTTVRKSSRLLKQSLNTIMEESEEDMEAIIDDTNNTNNTNHLGNARSVVSISSTSGHDISDNPIDSSDSMAENFDLDSIIKMGAKTKQEKSTKSAPTAKLPLDANAMLLLSIPSGQNKTLKIVQVPFTCGYDEAVARIHVTMGCKDIVRKPILTYKMAGTASGNTPYDLSNEEDWGALIVSARRLLKKTNLIIPVTIVADQKYLDSLRMRNGVNAKEDIHMPKGKKAKLKKEKAMNLDTLDDEDGADTPEEAKQSEKELEEFLRLKKMLRTCAVHTTPTEFCKINKHGAHVLLSSAQINGWANALAMKLYGVTYEFPPRGQLFEDFHTKQPDRDNGRRAQSAPPGSVSEFLTAMVMANSMFAGMPRTTEPQINNNNSRKRKLDVTESSETYSSDSEDTRTYPELAVFMEDLANKHPYRNLHTFKEDLQLNNFYKLNELKGKEETYFTEHPFLLSRGNASFITSEVKRAIKKIEKRTGRD